MRVSVEFTGLLNISTVRSGDEVNLESGATVGKLLDRLGIDEHHKKFITPLVNNRKARLTETLSDGDRVYLLLPVGGG